MRTGRVRGGQPVDGVAEGDDGRGDADQSDPPVGGVGGAGGGGVPAADQRVPVPHVRQCRGRVRGQGRQQFLVQRRERRRFLLPVGLSLAALLVHGLEHTDGVARGAEQRDGQQRAGAVPGGGVDALGDAGVGGGVGDAGGGGGAEHLPDQPGVGGNPQFPVRQPQRRPAHQRAGAGGRTGAAAGAAVARIVGGGGRRGVQEDAGPVAGQQVAGGGREGVQQRAVLPHPRQVRRQARQPGEPVGPGAGGGGPVGGRQAGRQRPGRRPRRPAGRWRRGPARSA